MKENPFWKRFKHDRLAMASLGVIVLLFIVALFGNAVAPYPFDLQNTAESLSPPSRAHWMGTDELGRDLFSRLIYGTRVSMSVSLLTALSALVLGTLYGAISGYVGGKIDNLMMRGVDVVYALPDLLLIILITVVIGRGIVGVFLALSLVGWITVARLIRGEVLRLKELSYIEAARSMGATHTRILLRHILPNTVGVLIVTLTFRIPSAILAESTLSFIGLGLTPPAASWGTLANEGWKALKFYPHLIIFPSLAIFITMLAFNFLGDGLRDALDPSRSDTPGPIRGTEMKRVGA
ncbi:MAG: ABC transporter permease [Candidatus Manganitrophus sp.]|nr:ABC transporter permease [Candidatus Manganitrophus sp.]WDT72217.1 MAG: ABC transporter permease [Candidatus Manganitrophus sp.]WDT80366.1 MAG: ABC transporter permease [Candidatus Manganitrophus sp.]